MVTFGRDGRFSAEPAFVPKVAGGAADHERVRPQQAPPEDRAITLAPVIQLEPIRRHLAAAERAPQASAATERALGVLARRAGLRGLELPADLGRPLARMSHLLSAAPTRLDAERMLPALAAELAALATSAADVTLEVVFGEAEVLGEALGTDLLGLRLDELHEVAEAVLAVSRAPRAAEQWADPRDAAEAERVILAAGDDLRAAATTHVWLQERFTDQVWEIPVGLLERAGASWRLVGRARLRRLLRLASRSGRPSLSASVPGVLAARRARNQVEAIRPQLTRYLGSLDRGPLSDADAALSAVRAVRRLQGALGLGLDMERLSRLLLADAFRSEDVFAPAVNVRLALLAWRRDVEGFGGAEAWSCTLDELADWTVEVLDLLPDLRSAMAAADGIGARAVSLRDLVDLHVVREHIAELTAAHAAALGSEAGGPASRRDEGVVS